MATNEVIRYHSAGRLRILFTVNHQAGDLVYEKGFYGWVQDDIDTSVTAWGVIHLAGVYDLIRAPATLAMGTKVYAPPSSIPTTLPISGGATTGYNAFGRSTATGNATAARIRLFSDNAY